MKPLLTSQTDHGPLLAFGAHPDDIEFGCGGVIALESQAGRPVHFVVCSRGEAGTNGTPEERETEAQNGAQLLGAAIAFIELDGDARLEIKSAHVIRIASIIRRARPQIILAPSLVENQHPDHARLGCIVRDAARLARYGGVAELRDAAPHSIGQLFYYALTTDSEPRDITPILIDVSAPEIVQTWAASMAAHVSQGRTRNYGELQLLRAKALGARAGIEHAIALFPNDPIVTASLAPLSRGARRF